MSKSRVPMYAQILCAMVLGAAVGVLFGKDAIALGKIGTLMIQVIKALAAPLLFLAIVDAFLTTEIKARDGGRLLVITGINAVIAVAIGLTISNVIQPGTSLHPPEAKVAPTLGKSVSVSESLAGYIPTNLVQPFVDNALVTIILIAVLMGLALRKVKREQIADGLEGYRAIEHGVKTLYRGLEVALGWIVRLIPIAVFSVVARTIGEYGFAPVRGLALYLVVALFGLSLQVGVVYQAWIVLVARMPLRRFWTGARDAVVYTMGASSSLATLPVTLKCLERMKVSRESSTLAACVGTNLNNDGILLYEAMAVLFVAQAYGIDLSLGQQLLVAGSCVIAGIGIAGVPDAGLISLALVLGTVGLPAEILPLLLTVDWLLSRARSMVNVTSDILVAVLLDRWKAPPLIPAVASSPNADVASREA